MEAVPSAIVGAGASKMAASGFHLGSRAGAACGQIHHERRSPGGSHKSRLANFSAWHLSTAKSKGFFPPIVRPVFLLFTGLPRSSAARLLASSGSVVPSETRTCLPSSEYRSQNVSLPYWM